MNATQIKLDGLTSTAALAQELKWEGHMADDVGATYGHEPLATLTATAEMLILAGTRGNFRLPRSSITKLGPGKMYPWLFSAVRIHHTVPGYPRDLQFKPLRLTPREVLAQLRQLGFPVA
jgi:hypothetical protein